MVATDQAYQLLKENITRLITLNDDECDDMCHLFHMVKLDKRDHWLEAGTVCTQIAFIVKGFMRSYCAHNDVERTCEFFSDKTWYTDYESWLMKQPSIMNLEAMEPTQLLVISFRDLERLYEEQPKWERVGRLMAESKIIEIKKKNLSLLNDSPEQRYVRLLKERPEVIHRVPQHLIASYLAIEPETLSRIRKKLSLKREVV